MNQEMEQQVKQLTKELDKELFDSELNSRQLAESLLQLVLVCDADGKNICTCPQWTNYTGMAANELTDYGWLQSVHPDDQEPLLKSWQKSKTTGTASKIAYRIRRSDGAYRWFDQQALPLRDASGQIVQWMWTNTDIHAQREADETLQKHNARLQALSDLSRTFSEAGPDYQSVVQKVVQSITEFVNDYCAICLFSEGGELVENKGAFHPDPAIREFLSQVWGTVPYALNESPLDKMIYETGQAVFLPKVDQAQLYGSVDTRIQSILDRITFNSLIVVPMRGAGRLVGLLCVGRTQLNQPSFDDDDLHLMQEMADRAALAIANAQLAQQRQEELTIRIETEKKLRASEHHLHTIVENLTEGLIIVDGDGQLSRWNRAALTMHGIDELSEATFHTSAMSNVYELATLEGRSLSPEECPPRCLLRGERVQNVELRIRRKDSDWERIFSYSGILIQEQNDSPFVLLNITDITERKQAEADIRRTKAQLEAVFQAINEGLIVADMDGYLVLVNEAEARMKGFASAEEMKKNLTFFREIFELTDLDGQCVPYEQWPLVRGLRGESFSDWELNLRQIDTGQQWVLSYSVQPVYNECGEQILAVLSTRDVTQRKQDEKALQFEQERFENLAQASPSAMYSFQIAPDNTSTLLYSSPVNYELLGFTPEEEKNCIAIIFERIYPEERARILASMSEAQRTKSVFHNCYRYLHPQKGEIWIEAYASATTSPDGVIIWHGIANDVTERIKAEASLRESEERFRTLFNGSALGQIIVDYEANRVVDCNHAAAKGLEYTREEMLELSLADFVVNPTPVDANHQAIAIGKNLQVRTQHRTKTGAIREVMVALTNIQIQGKDYVYGSILDITDQKRLEQETLDIAERLNLALTASQMGVWEWDLRTNNVFWSPECYKILGVETFAGTLEEFHQMVYPEDLEPNKKAVEIAVDRKELFSTEFRVVLPNEQFRWVSNLGRAQYNAQEKPLRLNGIVQDITQRKLAETELEQSLEQIRSLALHLQDVREEERKRIARELHDELGQALAGLKYDLAWLETNIVPTTSQMVKSLQQKTQSMAQMIDATIQIGRQIATELRPRVLDELGLQAALNWQARDFQMRTGIRCEFLSLSENLPLDAERATAAFRICQETLTNVLRHAQASAVTIQLQVENNCLRLEIKDNGRGITKRDINRPGALGLLGMKERVLPYGGKIDIEGRIGRGTTITVTLPLDLLRR